jgi:hypothetical protein
METALDEMIASSDAPHTLRDRAARLSSPSLTASSNTVPTPAAVLAGVTSMVKNVLGAFAISIDMCAYNAVCCTCLGDGNASDTELTSHSVSSTLSNVVSSSPQQSSVQSSPNSKSSTSASRADSGVIASEAAVSHDEPRRASGSVALSAAPNTTTNATTPTTTAASTTRSESQAHGKLTIRSLRDAFELQKSLVARISCEIQLMMLSCLITIDASCSVGA